MATDIRLKFYTTEQLGPKRHMTPEGFLVCEEVPIARIGDMIYGPGETPVPVGPSGRAVITRSEKEVFNSDSMASIVGKPVVNDHPPVDVDPTNWKFYLGGVVMSSRRGTGDLKDYLVSDIIIYDPELIDDVKAGKREVSCGYNPDYKPIIGDDGEEIAGRGEQTDIIYNHLALVERGRCGPRCSIGDRFTVDKEIETMSKRKSVVDRIREAFTAKDERALDAVLETIDDESGTANSTIVHNYMPGARDAEEEPNVEIHNHPPGGDEGREDMPRDRRDEEMPPWFKEHKDQVAGEMESIKDTLAEFMKEKKEGEDAETEEEKKTGDEPSEREEMARKIKEEEARGKNKDEEILGELEFEAPPGTGDRARSAKDSVYLGDSFQDALAKAEILAPGIRLPTFDEKMGPKKTFAAISSLRRTALDLAYGKAETRGLIDVALSGHTLNTKKMSDGSVRTLFNAVAGMRAADNNRSTDGFHPVQDGSQIVRGSIQTISDLNKRNRDRYQPRKTA